MNPHWRKLLSFLLSVLFFVGQVVLGYAAETNFWSERQKSLSQATKEAKAVIPANFVIPAKAGIQAVNHFLKKV